MVALEKYALEQPDLVLLDMTMRGMHGLEVLNQLRQMDSGVCVVVATADVQRSTRDLVAAGGARGFVTKPFDANQVLEAVSAALAGEVR